EKNGKNNRQSKGPEIKPFIFCVFDDFHVENSFHRFPLLKMFRLALAGDGTFHSPQLKPSAAAIFHAWSSSSVNEKKTSSNLGWTNSNRSNTIEFFRHNCKIFSAVCIGFLVFTMYPFSCFATRPNDSISFTRIS